MFVEAWMEERRQRAKEKQLNIMAQRLSEILKTRDLTKDDIPYLKQLFSTEENS